MARDYKNSTSRRRKDSSGLTGTAGFVCGLAFGLAVALGVYLYSRSDDARIARSAPPISSEEQQPAPAKPAPASQNPETHFDFYEMLPKFEVVIPEQDGASAPTTARSVQQPGAYILQAGSFRNHADADRMRALIAMQGVESKIQQVTIDQDTWHRVRIGPINNLNALEDTRSKLRQAQIEALVIRVGE